jgi:hypothetical protein
MGKFPRAWGIGFHPGETLGLSEKADRGGRGSAVRRGFLTPFTPMFFLILKIFIAAQQRH